MPLPAPLPALSAFVNLPSVSTGLSSSREAAKHHCSLCLLATYQAAKQHGIKEAYTVQLLATCMRVRTHIACVSNVSAYMLFKKREAQFKYIKAKVTVVLEMCGTEESELTTWCLSLMPSNNPNCVGSVGAHGWMDT